MTYLPFENIIYETQLTEREILNRLNEVVQPQRFFDWNPFRKDRKPYEGTVDDTGFKIHPNPYYRNSLFYNRNSFRPVITGTIRRDFKGYEVHVKMRLPAS